MENLDTVATLGTQDRGRRQTKRKQYTTQTTKMMSNMDLTNNTRGEPRYSQRVNRFLSFTIHPPYCCYSQ
jgi:hypothetical protein